MATLGLCMIAKNEAHVIRECLESVAPLVDRIVISDTGSTDGTQALCRAWMSERGIPGEVFDEPWRDFATNRNRVFERLREYVGVDYAFVMDADDLLTVAPGLDMPALKATLSADVYSLAVGDGGTSYFRPQIVRNAAGHMYRGVLHEFLESPREASRETLAGLNVISRRLGDRSRDPEKYARDAAVLEKALWNETDEFMRARYFFYLAQSYKDAGDPVKAIVAYRERARKGFFAGEVFISLYRVAQLMQSSGYPAVDVLAAYREAAAFDPARAEPLYGAAQFCRLQERYEEGYQLALRGLAIPKPPSALFLENWVYDYSLLDEFSILAYWAGHYRESLDACADLLMSDAVPADQLERIRKNARVARSKVAQAWLTSSESA